MGAVWWLEQNMFYSMHHTAGFFQMLAPYLNHKKPHDRAVSGLFFTQFALCFNRTVFILERSCIYTHPYRGSGG